MLGFYSGIATRSGYKVGNTNKVGGKPSFPCILIDLVVQTRMSPGNGTRYKKMEVTLYLYTCPHTCQNVRHNLISGTLTKKNRHMEPLVYNTTTHL